jgi:hypothetical protein
LERRAYQERDEELARGDLLAASIATFFLNDAVSRVLAFGDVDDRGIALERAFERHWQWDMGFRIQKENAEVGFLAIRRSHGRPLPNLLLNGTDVRTGRRAITSSIAFTPGDDLFAAADDFLSRLNYDVGGRQRKVCFPTGLTSYGGTAISCRPRPDEVPKQVVLGREAEGRKRAEGGAILPVLSHL